jgi:hypothetical protein
MRQHTWAGGCAEPSGVAEGEHPEIGIGCLSYVKSRDERPMGLGRSFLDLAVRFVV